MMPEVIFVEAPRRRRRWPWFLLAFVLMSLLCCGVCASFAAPIGAQYPARVAARPAEVEGLKRNDNPIVKTVAAVMADRFRLEPWIDDAFAAMYTDPKSDKRNVIFFGATLFIWDPDGEFDKVIQGAGETLSNVTEYPPGVMGGELRCGNGEDDKGEPVILCAWADHGSLGVGIFYGDRPMDECASILSTLREKIIIRPNG